MRFVYVGSEPRDFPAEAGVTVYEDSFTVAVGGMVDADENPDPRWFDPETVGPPENKES